MITFLLIWSVVGAGCLIAALDSRNFITNYTWKQEALIIFLGGPAIWSGIAALFIGDYFSKKLK